MTASQSPHPRLILASASPRRRELLTEAGYDFAIVPADIDEDDFPPSILPADLAASLAYNKAWAIAEKHPDDFVLGADTVVAFGDLIIGKPRDRADAGDILRLLSGSTHVVITGVALLGSARDFRRTMRVYSIVRMKPISNRQIEEYLATGDWQGKAGAYGIQDQRDDPFVLCTSGSFSNVVGLPMERTRQLLAEAGIAPATASRNTATARVGE